MKKCECDDCERTIEDNYKFCSVECACYAGKFSVRLKDDYDKTKMDDHKTI